MSNLLPKEQKQTIKKEYIFRMTIVILNFFVLTGIIILLILSPSLLLLNLKYNSSKQEIGRLERENPELKNISDLQAVVLETKNKINLLKEVAGISPLFVWKEITSSKPDGIEIKVFSYNEEKETALVGGEAKTRDFLTSFAKNLESKEIFSSVNLPISTLAKEKEITFSIDFSVK